mgnify:CR=1 FL=1
MVDNREAKVVYDSALLTNPFVDEIRNLIDTRFILRRMIYTDFKIRYRRSFLGVLWSLLNPFLNMLVFVIVFSNLFRSQISHYPLYLLTGNMVFSFFSASTSGAMRQVISNSSMIRRVFLPKTIYVLALIGNNAINLFLTVIIIIPMLYFEKIEVTSAILFIFPAFLLVTGFIIGVSLILATVTAFLNDFSQLWSIILIFWTYLTPIFYPESIIPESYIHLYRMNPMYVFVRLFRDSVVYGSISSPDLWLKGFVFSFVTLVFGWWIFTRNSNNFAYMA